VLLVEDDALLGDAIQAGLKQSGYAADWMQDGIAAEQALATEPYAAVVLDLGCPVLPGWRCCAVCAPAMRRKTYIPRY
jgi:DNA-binding response OmpR family regulator